MLPFHEIRVRHSVASLTFPALKIEVLEWGLFSTLSPDDVKRKELALLMRERMRVEPGDPMTCSDTLRLAILKRPSCHSARFMVYL